MNVSYPLSVVYVYSVIIQCLMWKMPAATKARY